MKIHPFKLEEYLTKYEFSSPYLLCCSDAESFSIQELLAMANPSDRKLWDDLRLNYTEPYGMSQLRAQIAASLYPGLEPANILCFAGAEEGIFACLHVLCEPENHVIVLTPCYQSHTEVPLLKGASVTEVSLKAKNQWHIDVNEIALAIKQNTVGVVINFPHNPTGQVITQRELENLVFLCQQHDLWLFSDEVYHLLGSPKEGWATPAALAYPKAISLSVMSKAYGMPGLRIGWIACQDKKLIHQCKQMKDYLSICNSAPSEVISLIALKNKETILARNNGIVSENLHLLDQLMADFPYLFEWTRPQGGCVGFVKYKGKEPVDQFCQQLVQEKGVLLLPASVYGSTEPYFRIGFGRKNMPEALSKLKEHLLACG